MAVGGEAVGLVGVDGGGGWNGTIVICLLIVDNNKSSVRVCQCLLWVYPRNIKVYRVYIHILEQLHSAAERVPN